MVYIYENIYVCMKRKEIDLALVEQPRSDRLYFYTTHDGDVEYGEDLSFKSMDRLDVNEENISR